MPAAKPVTCRRHHRTTQLSVFLFPSSVRIQLKNAQAHEKQFADVPGLKWSNLYIGESSFQRNCVASVGMPRRNFKYDQQEAEELIYIGKALP